MRPEEVTSARDASAASQIWAACPGSQRAASPRNTASCGARITSTTAAVEAPMTLRSAAPSPADSSSTAVNQTTVLPPAHSAAVDIAGHAARLAPTRTLATTSPVPASTMSRAIASRPRAGVTSRLVMPCAVECSPPAAVTPAATKPICTASAHTGATSSSPRRRPSTTSRRTDIIVAAAAAPATAADHHIAGSVTTFTSSARSARPQTVATPAVALTLLVAPAPLMRPASSTPSSTPPRTRPPTPRRRRPPSESTAVRQAGRS